jgi:hypothetical protein
MSQPGVKCAARNKFICRHYATAHPVLLVTKGFYFLSGHFDVTMPQPGAECVGDGKNILPAAPYGSIVVRNRTQITLRTRWAAIWRVPFSPRQRKPTGMATFVTLPVVLCASNVFRTGREVAMVWGDPQFADLMAEVQRVTVILDGLTQRDGSKATAAAVSDAKGIYARLLEHQKTAWLTAAEANALQNSVDSLRARLKFFGESL